MLTTNDKKKESRKVSQIEKDIAKLYNNKGNKVENENEWKRI